MTLKHLRSKIKEAMTGFEPLHVQVTKEDRDLLHIQVISEWFKGLTLLTRIDNVLRQIQFEAEEIEENYTLIVEPMTTKEYRLRHPKGKALK